MKSKCLGFAGLLVRGELCSTTCATAAAVRGHECVGRNVLFRWVFPSVHLYWVGRETLQRYLGSVLRVKRGKAVVTDPAVKEHHVAKDTFTFQHVL